MCKVIQISSVRIRGLECLIELFLNPDHSWSGEYQAYLTTIVLGRFCHVALNYGTILQD